MSYNELDINYMQRAIELAERGGGFVHPNPLVGCVVVKNNEIISEGWHEYYGGFHAERNALINCNSDTKDATLYVTLEPCCHYGKTPPCTEIIIEKGIKRVVVGLLDPNPLVAGKGISILRNAGIEVEVGIEEQKIKELNKVFLKYISTKLPYVLMKTAMTLDGKIASYSGDSKWITNEESRKIVHQLRNEMMAIMVGIGTVQSDDPLLTCRLDGNVCQPIRIIADSKASIRLDSQIVATAKEYRTIIAHTSSASTEKLERLHELGVETLCCKEQSGQINIRDMIMKIGELGIDSILLEGGATLNASFLENQCVDEIYAFLAPKIIGGTSAKSPVGGHGIEKMKDALKINDLQIQNIENDILIKGKILY